VLRLLLQAFSIHAAPLGATVMKSGGCAAGVPSLRLCGFA
jgi:hypothetical protein